MNAPENLLVLVHIWSTFSKALVQQRPCLILSISLILWNAQWTMCFI